MSANTPAANPRRDDGEDRSGMERRSTDEDRRRLEGDEGRRAGAADGADLGDERRRSDVVDESRADVGDERRRGTAEDERRRLAADEGTRPISTTRATPAAAGVAGEGYARDERPMVAPGAARGRLHVGINWGAAFFGWVAAMGLAVILTAFIAAVGAAVGVSRGATTAQAASDQLQQSSQTVGLLGIILLAVVAFVSYYAGGYVAARMSRFDGARQGFAVWLWAIIVAIVVAIVAAVAGARFDVLSTLNTFPRIPVNQGDLTGTGVIALVVLLVITLLGAVIGGAGGMRYHRKLETAEAEYLGQEG